MTLTEPLHAHITHLDTGTAPLTDDSPAPEFDHERVLVVTGPRSGLVICIAVHSTVLGQALGGCRLWRYDHWRDAQADALRLSAAMTLKNAAAGLNRGGGKAVIQIPHGTVLTEQGRAAAMLDLGDAVESLGGAYMTAEDVGTSAELMAVVAQRTRHVCGLPPEQGGVGEPADATASGVFAAIGSTLKAIHGSRDPRGRHLVNSGLGQVGGRLARALVAAGATLTVTDVDAGKRALADELGAAWVEPGQELAVEADVFVPCGLGGVLTPSVVAGLKVAAVAGAANNQLASRDVARLLTDRGILWAPDFVANAGGVIYLDAASGPGADLAAIDARVAAIGDTVTEVFRSAAAAGTTTLAAAERLAQARLDAV
jgi:leucine dehydrogenase